MFLRQSLFLILLSFAFFGFFVSTAQAADPWYNTDWIYRTKITIDHTKVASSTGTNLSYFPVLVSTTSAAFKDVTNSGHVGQSDGGDILFTSSDGTTKLDHEIEIYASSTGQVIAWIEVPTVSTSTDTVLYMYYGNVSAANQWNITGTWDDGGSNYNKGVFHLPDGTTLSANDSSPSGNNGTINGTGLSATSTSIGGGASFPGNNATSYISGSNTGISGDASVTMSAIINWKAAATGDYPAVIGNNTGSTNAGLSLTFNNSKPAIDFWNNRYQASAALSSNTTYWVTVTKSPGSIHNTSKIYINGVQVAGGGAVATPNITNSQLIIGKLLSGGSAAREWNGTLDEVRISNTTRSADWVKTEYNNQSSPSTFYSILAEEQLPVPDAPTSLVTSSGNGQVYLSWTAPLNNEDVSVTDYVLDYKLTSDLSWSTFADGVSTTTSGVITGLINGASYDFRVSAVNIIGQGIASAVSTVTPATTPESSTIISVVPGDGEVMVSFSELFTPWYDPDWAYRKKITIDHTKVENTNQTHFPVLISLTDSDLQYGGGGHMGKSNAGDIIFTSSEGTIKLNHEIEKYDSSTGQIIAWVKVPILSSSVDTDVYLYYGNAAATNQWDITGTWDDGGNDYNKGIYHLPDGATLSANDSSVLGNNGTFFGTPTATAGQIGGAGNFSSASGQYVNVADTASNSLTGEFTLSAWINTNSNSTQQGIIEKYTSPGVDGYGFRITSAGKLLVFTSNSSSQGSVTGLGTISAGTWYYASAVYNGSTIKTYINGVLDNSASDTINPTDGASSLKLGARGDDGSRSFNGLLDEMRVSAVARSADWIKTEYNNQNSPSTFFSVSSEESFLNLIGNGGSAVTSYTVTSNPGGFTGTGASSPITVTGLTNGTAYTFTVTATNAVGEGPASASSGSVTPATTPNAPTAVSSVVGNTQITLLWSAPAYDGGSSITDYVIEYKLTSEPTVWSVFSDGVSIATTTTVTGLTNGSSYDFRVSAANSAGQGTSSGSVTATPITTPGAPTSIVATRGNTQASISFTPPISDGGSTITSYTITSNPGNIIGTGASSPITVTGLTNGTAYTFTVTATNAAGTGASSASSNSITPATVPDAPTSPSAVGGNEEVTVSFTESASNGGSAITEYFVTSSPGGLIGVGSNSPIVLSGLTNGTAYTFTVFAVNDVGTSSASVDSNSVTPMTTPGAPTIDTVTPGNAQVSVAFTPPVSDGGSTITSYTVTSNPGGFTGTGASSPITVTGLTNGTAYTFTVTATNAVGEGVASIASDSTTPFTVPDPPTALTPTAGDTQVDLVWTAPTIDGGSPITDYVIEYKLTSEPTVWSTFADGVSTSLSGAVSGLTNGSSYDFRVSAANSAGQGSASAIATAIPVTTPGAPTIDTVTPGNAQVSVAFTPPVSDGGSTITSYTVTSNPGGFTGTGASSPITVTGLTNGTAYTFTVTATNAVGEGPASASSSLVTPVTVPGAPTSVSAVEGNSQATVTFTPPTSDGGTAITGYTVTSNPGGFTGTGASSPITVTGLTNGTAYTFTVTATNAVGTGTSSDPSNSVTLSTEPTAPVNLAATVYGSGISLSWSPPVSNGGTSVTDYVIEYQLTTGGVWSVFADGTNLNTTALVTGLSNGTSYDFRVSAINSIGQSVPSGSVTATPGEPAQVIIQSVSDATVPSIATEIRITNEGAIAFEYQYTWCITDSSSNDCGGGDDLFSSTAAKLIQSGENWDTTLNSTVSTPGNYYFHINVFYGSESSNAYQSFTAVATYPDAPTSIVATSTSGGEATITFTAPVSNGGASITSYTVTSGPGGLTATASSSPITVTGLTNGTAYTFTVTATNAVGEGPASAPSNSVTPVSVPGIPTNISATAGNTQAILSWSPPTSDGGSPITDYVIEYKLTSEPIVWSVFSDGVSTLTTVTIPNLLNNTSYDFRISAVNAVGQSAINSTSAILPNDVSTTSTSGGRSGGTRRVINTTPTNISTTSPAQILPNNQTTKAPSYPIEKVVISDQNPNQISVIPTEKPIPQKPKEIILVEERGVIGQFTVVIYSVIILAVVALGVKALLIWMVRRRKNY